MYLGINGFSHDASAAIVDEEGRIIAAVEEERFSRRKKEDRFPVESIRYCLNEAGISLSDLKGIGYGWHPLLLLRQRILWGNLVDYPVPLAFLAKNVRKMLNSLSIKRRIEAIFGPLDSGIEVRYFKHHTAHAASAFFASPFHEAAFLTIDGRGELETATWGYARCTEIQQLGANHHPNSVGNLYSAIARFCGYFGLEKDGTLMALAACGEPVYQKDFRQLVRFNRPESHERFEINRDYFDCRSGDGIPQRSLERFFGVNMRAKDGVLQQQHKDIAASMQAVTEELIVRLCRDLHKLTRMDKLVLAGGVALNSVTNGILRAKTPFKDIFIQPAANDAGLALGCAYLLAHSNKCKRTRHTMTTASLGPSFSRDQILRTLERHPKLAWNEPADIAITVADMLSKGKTIAWFQERLEYGPRSLGNRSILADARKTEIQKELNIIKRREAFRPFAVAILAEETGEWLHRGTDSPFMLLVDQISEKHRLAVPGARHVDNSVRVQTVSIEERPLFHALIKEFFRITGIPLVINTSFNLPGEPIVCSPDDAIHAFGSMNIDALAIGPFLVTKREHL